MLFCLKSDSEFSGVLCIWYIKIANAFKIFSEKDQTYAIVNHLYGHKCVTKASVSLYSRRIHIWCWVLVLPGLSRSGATRVVTTGWLCLECLGCRYRRKHVREPLRRGEAKAGAAAEASQSKCSAKTKVSRPSDVGWGVLGSGGATSRFLVLIKFHLKPL